MNPELEDISKCEEQRVARMRGGSFHIYRRAISCRSGYRKQRGRKHRDTVPRARPPEEAREWGDGCRQVGKLLR